MTSAQGSHICLVFLGDVRYDGRACNFTASLLHAGHRLTWIAVGGRPESFPEARVGLRRIRLRRWPFSKLRFLEFYLKAFHYAARVRADLYQAEDLYSLPVAWFGARLHGGRLSYDCRELYFALGSLAGRPLTQAIWRWVERFWIRRTDLVIVTAEAQRPIVAARYRIAPPLVVRNHPSSSLRPEGPSPLRSTLGIAPETRVILYQGMLHPGRGIFLPLEILALLPDCVMVYLAFGELRERLEREIGDRGLRDRVFRIGPLPYGDLLALTAGADVGLALQEPLSENHLEARPNKIFEYIMAGVPVVTSDFPPLREAVEGTGVGLVADVTDIEDVAAKVGRILTDDAARGEMVRRCRAAAERFCWEADEPALLDAIARLLPGAPGRRTEGRGVKAAPGEGA